MSPLIENLLKVEATDHRKIQEETSYLLNVRTELTKSGRPEVITRIPNHLSAKLKRKYYDTKNLADI